MIEGQQARVVGDLVKPHHEPGGEYSGFRISHLSAALDPLYSRNQPEEGECASEGRQRRKTKTPRGPHIGHRSKLWAGRFVMLFCSGGAKGDDGMWWGCAVHVSELRSG